MRVLVIGSSGNMGRRYCAIVRHLGHTVVPFDIADQPKLPDRAEYDTAIITSPIGSHTGLCLRLIKHKCNFLCEKPISKNPADVEAIARACQDNGVSGYMVNNWSFIGWPNYIEPHSVQQIRIRTYYTGPDGVWDLIQPRHLLAPDGVMGVPKDMPVIYVELGRGKQVRATDFEISYILMAQAFLNNKTAQLKTHRSCRKFLQNLWVSKKNNAYSVLWPIDEDLVETHRKVAGLEQGQ